MTDSQRAKILKNKSINNVAVVKDISADILEKATDISSWEDINNLFGSKKSTLIQKLASEFGAFKGYSNADINISFEFSKNNFRESYHKQKVNYEQFAKMFSVFDSVVENAIGIEVHNRNTDGYKTDITLNNVYVLMSAFEDGDYIIPVKLEIKEFKDKQNALYVAISLQGIKKAEVSKQGNTENGVTQNSRSAIISIVDLFTKINPKDIDFIKYIPNELLTDEQTVAKNKATSAVKKSLRDPAFVSDREMLADALMSAVVNDGEYKILDDYKKNIKKMYSEQQKLDNLNEQIKELTFASGRRNSDELRRLRDEVTKTRNRISVYDKKLLRLEAAAPLREVLKREKRAAE